MNDRISVLMTQADPVRADDLTRTDSEDLLRAILATVRSDPAPARRASRSTTRGRLVPLLIAGVAALALVFGAGILLPRLVAPAGVEADWPWYESESQLFERADAVLLGEVVAVRDEVREQVANTVVTVRVEATAKGPFDDGDEVDVAYPAQAEPAPVGLRMGDRAVVFVALFPDVPDAPAAVLNPAQGSYLVGADGDVRSRDDNPIRLSDGLLTRLGLTG